MKKSNRKIQEKFFLTILLLAFLVTISGNKSYAKSVAGYVNALRTQKVCGLMANGVNDKVCVTWEPVPYAMGYLVYEKQNGGFKCLGYTRNTQVVLKDKTRGARYYYGIIPFSIYGGKVYGGRVSNIVNTRVPEESVSTIKNFLKVGLGPMGSTMYVWGGGWNKEDTAAGDEARRLGTSAQWRKFASTKNSSYNHKAYSYQIHNGLDCSGYVGWCVYNTLESENGRPGYVYLAKNQGRAFSSMGLGLYTPASLVKDYKAGDVMTSGSHVYIVVGSCADGSVVLMHSSVSGVTLSGTTTPGGNKNSRAVLLAAAYMRAAYPSFYRRYPGVSRSTSYLKDYGQMRWYPSVLSDPEGLRDMDADHVLRSLFFD